MRGFVPVATAPPARPAAAGAAEERVHHRRGPADARLPVRLVVQLRSLTVVKQITPGSPAVVRLHVVVVACRLAVGERHLRARLGWFRHAVADERRDGHGDRGRSERRSLERSPGWCAPRSAPTAHPNPYRESPSTSRPARWCSPTSRRRPSPPSPASPARSPTPTRPKATLTLVKQVTAGPRRRRCGRSRRPDPPRPRRRARRSPVRRDRPPSRRSGCRPGPTRSPRPGPGAAATGYVQQGAWVCPTAGGTTVPVTTGSVTLADSAASHRTANVTCTVTNRLADGLAADQQGHRRAARRLHRRCEPRRSPARTTAAPGSPGRSPR